MIFISIPCACVMFCR